MQTCSLCLALQCLMEPPHWHAVAAAEPPASSSVSDSSPGNQVYVLVRALPIVLFESHYLTLRSALWVSSWSMTLQWVTLSNANLKSLMSLYWLISISNYWIKKIVFDVYKSQQQVALPQSSTQEWASGALFRDLQCKKKLNPSLDVMACWSSSSSRL